MKTNLERLSAQIKEEIHGLIDHLESQIVIIEYGDKVLHADSVIKNIKEFEKEILGYLLYVKGDTA